MGLIGAGARAARRGSGARSLALFALIAAAGALPTAADASKHRSTYRSASYKVVYQGSGTYNQDATSGLHTIHLKETFHWKVKYIADLSTRPKANVIGPMLSGDGGGTWTYDNTLSSRGASITCSGGGTLKPVVPWYIQPTGGMMTGKTERSGDVKLLMRLVETGAAPFKAVGEQNNNCQPGEAMDAASAPWGGDPLALKLTVPKKSIGKHAFVHKITFHLENLDAVATATFTKG